MSVSPLWQPVYLGPPTKSVTVKTSGLKLEINSTTRGAQGGALVTVFFQNLFLVAALLLSLLPSHDHSSCSPPSFTLMRRLLRLPCPTRPDVNMGIILQSAETGNLTCFFLFFL